jgi:hypothetical protein
VDVEDPVGESVEAAVGELDEAPDEESDDESGGSARASPCPESTATPTPSVIIRPANRPMSRTTFLTRDIRHDNNLSGKRKQAGGVRKGEVLMIGSNSDVAGYLGLEPRVVWLPLWSGFAVTALSQLGRTTRYASRRPRMLCPSQRR